MSKPRLQFVLPAIKSLSLPKVNKKHINLELNILIKYNKNDKLKLASSAPTRSSWNVTFLKIEHEIKGDMKR